MATDTQIRTVRTLCEEADIVVGEVRMSDLMTELLELRRQQRIWKVLSVHDGMQEEDGLD